MEPLARTRPLVFATNGDPDFLLMAEELLESVGYAAVTMLLIDLPFTEIVRLLPDLLIIDFPYGDQLAWALLAMLDANPATRLLPIIATSTHPDSLRRFTAQRTIRTASAVLLKPYDLDPLLALVVGLVPVAL